jgi:hypothetical protein
VIHRGRKVEAISFRRYNGGVRVKRQWGSSTVTVFYVFFEDVREQPSQWHEIEGFGRTPGERKTYAMQRFVEKVG